jgi:hypothetical protein
MLTCILLVQSVWLFHSVIHEQFEIKPTWGNVNFDIWESHQITAEVGHYSRMLAVAYLSLYSYDGSGRRKWTYPCPYTIYPVAINHTCKMQDLTCGPSNGDET